MSKVIRSIHDKGNKKDEEDDNTKPVFSGVIRMKIYFIGLEVHT